MKTRALILLSVLSLAGLLTAKGLAAPQALTVLLKALCSLLFVALILVRPKPDRGYFGFILTGLLLGLIGDVALEFEGPAAFLLGLGAFLLGHLAYVVAFACLRPLRRWFGWPVLPIWLIAAAVFIWLYPYTNQPGGDLRLPVAVYVSIISLMVTGAAALSRTGGLTRAFKTLVLVGAILFFLSDVLVAINAFVRNQFLFSLILLPLYYAAQLMLAASAAKK